MKHTFCKFAAVELASLELDGDNMSEGLMKKLDVANFLHPIDYVSVPLSGDQLQLWRSE